MRIKLYDGTFEQFVEDAPRWVREAPEWVQHQLANVPYVAHDPNGRVEKETDEYYRVFSRGHCYGAVFGQPNVR